MRFIFNFQHVKGFTWIISNAFNFNMIFTMKKTHLCIMTKLAISLPPIAKFQSAILKILVYCFTNFCYLNAPSNNLILLDLVCLTTKYYLAALHKMWILSFMSLLPCITIALVATL